MHTPEKSSVSSISQSVESRHGTVVSVPVVCSEPPRPRYRDRSVCGQSLPTLPTVSPEVLLPSGHLPKECSFPSGQLPQWSVSPVVSVPSGQCWSVVSSPAVGFPTPVVSSPVVSVGQCRSVSVGQCRSVSVGVSRSVSVSVGQFPQWSVSPVVSFPGGQCRSVVSFPSKFPQRSVLLVRFPRSVSPVVGLRQLKQARSWSSLASSLTSSRRGPRSGQCPR